MTPFISKREMFYSMENEYKLCMASEIFISHVTKGDPRLGIKTTNVVDGGAGEWDKPANIVQLGPKLQSSAQVLAQS